MFITTALVNIPVANMLVMAKARNTVCVIVNMVLEEGARRTQPEGEENCSPKVQGLNRYLFILCEVCAARINQAYEMPEMAG